MTAPTTAKRDPRRLSIERLMTIAVASAVGMGCNLLALTMWFPDKRAHSAIDHFLAGSTFFLVFFVVAMALILWTRGLLRWRWETWSADDIAGRAIASEQWPPLRQGAHCIGAAFVASPILFAFPITHAFSWGFDSEAFLWLAATCALISAFGLLGLLLASAVAQTLRDFLPGPKAETVRNSGMVRATACCAAYLSTLFSTMLLLPQAFVAVAGDDARLGSISVLAVLGAVAVVAAGRRLAKQRS